MERKLAYIKARLQRLTADDEPKKLKLEKKLSKVEGKLEKVELIRPVADAAKATLFDLLKVEKHGWPEELKNTFLFEFVGEGKQGFHFAVFFSFWFYETLMLY